MSYLGPTGKRIAHTVVRYSDDIKTILQRFSEAGYELETAYFVQGEGHHLYFCQYYALEDTSKRIKGQTESIPNYPHTTRNKARSSKM